MGPGDPFAAQGGWTPPSAEAELSADPPDAQPGPDAVEPDSAAPASDKRRRQAMACGLLIGLLFGAIVVFRGVGAAVVVSVCGGVGLAAGWIIYAALNDGLDIRAAIRALRRRS